MQKKRSRKNGTATDGPAPAGRRVHVRSRLVVGVAVAGLTVLAAGAPAVVTATRELNDSQQLVTLAEQTRHTLTLAHLLADERDAVVEYVAKGRPGGQAKGPLQERAALTDRRIAEVRAEAEAEADEPLAKAVGSIQGVRTEAVDGKGTALAAHQAYAGVLAELLAPGDRLAEQTPPRAEAALATTRPLAPLGQAVEQASATRGLLLAALAVPRSEQGAGAAAADELSAAAQRARVREQAALDDFTRAARPDVRQTLAATVTGPEVKAADENLKRLTERPTLSTADRKLDGASLAPSLTARLDRMRSVEATLAGQRATALAALRDDDVTRLELVVAVLGLLFLVAVGVSTAVARSLTRPLSVLRRGAARLATPEGSVEPVRFTGRNDEFAEVVRHLNQVREQTVSLHTKIAGMDADRRRLIGRNEALSTGRDALEAELRDLRAGLEEHRRIMSTTSVSLSLRTLGLVERQLAVIEELEAKEQDPDRLETFFRLDHLATVMRRHNENLLVLAGQEHGTGAGAPVPLVDVMRAAVSEIERYERVDLAVVPSFTQVAGHAADDISHVLAELLENATTFSPPGAKVKASARHLDTGDVVFSVVDEGIGVTPDRLEALNTRLATPDAYDEETEAEHGLGLGLYVAGRLAARHGVTAELRAGRHGGTEALVVVPAALLQDGPPAASPVHTYATPAGLPQFLLPGVVAEANEHVLPPRLRPEEGEGTAGGAGAGAGAGAAGSGGVAGAAEAAADEEPADAHGAYGAPAAPGGNGEAAAGAAAHPTGAAEGAAEAAGPAAAGQGADPLFDPLTDPLPEFAADPLPEPAAETLSEFAAESQAEFADPQAGPVADPQGAPVAGALPEPGAESPAEFGAGPLAEPAAETLPEFAAESQAEFADPQAGPVADPQGATVAGAQGDAAAQDDVRAEGLGGVPGQDDVPAEGPPAGSAAGQGFAAPVQAVAPVTLADAFAADAAAAAEGTAADAHASAPGDAPAPLPTRRRVPQEQLPPAEQVFTAQTPADRDPGDELLARVVPDTERSAFGVADTGPAAAESSTAAAPQAAVPDGDPALPGQSAAPAAPDAERLPPTDQVFTAGGGVPAAAEPHRHAPADNEWVPRQGSHPQPGTTEAVTDKGLPKRTPRVVAADRARTAPGTAAGPGAAPARPAPRRVDAEELRRRLGGFYQGTRDGRRVVAAELAQDTDQGDTAQEART
ncbi:nitrate- and nitrite sensing domain-containing protein [Streptomyces globosus]|uniref:sensor histidine kinase n=2 Tax=Streptomyces TaxID=1883 RepID=UPI0038206982